MSGTNPVATFVRSDYTTQDPATYKGAIDGDFAVAQRFATYYAPHAQSSPNMTVRIDAGITWDGSTLTEIAAQSTGTITAPSVHDRIDRIVLDVSTGAASVVGGVEAVSPVAPAIPSGKLPCAQVLLHTGTTAIGNSLITDERIMQGSSGTLPSSIVFTGALTPTQITASVDDYNPTGLSAASSLRLSTSARWNITGLSGGAAGRQMTIHNINTFPLVFTYNDAASSAANRFAFGATLGGGQSCILEYDGVSALWRAKTMPDPVGTLREHAGGTIPGDALGCDGSAVSRTTYAALFNEIGTTWGAGNGTTTFNVPDHRRRSAVGSGGSGTATLGNAVGNTGGEEGHALTLAENGPHSHGGSTGGQTSDHSHAGVGGPFVIGTAGSGNGTPGTTDNVTYQSNTGGSSNDHAHAISSSGSGTAHNTYHPSAVVTKVIKYC